MLTSLYRSGRSGNVLQVFLRFKYSWISKIVLKIYYIRQVCSRCITFCSLKMKKINYRCLLCFGTRQHIEYKVTSPCSFAVCTAHCLILLDKLAPMMDSRCTKLCQHIRDLHPLCHCNRNVQLAFSHALLLGIMFCNVLVEHQSMFYEEDI
jgi:hypothetical protein